MTAQVLERVRTGPPRDKELEGLTAQEQRILELIGEGLTNRQIAERMYLAEKTVKNYVSSCWPSSGSPAGPRRRSSPQAPADQ